MCLPYLPLQINKLCTQIYYPKSGWHFVSCTNIQYNKKNFRLASDIFVSFLFFENSLCAIEKSIWICAKCLMVDHTRSFTVEIRFWRVSWPLFGYDFNTYEKRSIIVNRFIYKSQPMLMILRGTFKTFRIILVQENVGMKEKTK